MERKAKQISERCGAILLIVSLLISTMLPHFTLPVRAAGADVTIKITDDPEELYVGDNYELSAELTNIADSDIEKIEWESSDDEVIRITEASDKDKKPTIEALKAGDAVITVKVTESGETDLIEASLSTEVKEIPEVSISETILGMAKVGEIIQLQVEKDNMGDMESVTWSLVSGDDVADLEDVAAGKFLIKKKGSFKVEVSVLYKGNTYEAEGQVDIVTGKEQAEISVEGTFELEYAIPKSLELEDLDLTKIAVAYGADGSEELFDFRITSTGIEVIGKREGTGSLLIYMEGDEVYDDSPVKEVTIVVAKSELHIKSITVSPQVYDGTTTVQQATFEIETDDLTVEDAKKADQIKNGIDLRVEFKSADAEEKEGLDDFEIKTLDFGDCEWKDKYTLIVDNSVVEQIKSVIKHYPIPIIIENNNAPVQYSDFNWTSYGINLCAVINMTEAELVNLPDRVADVLTEEVKKFPIIDPGLDKTADVGKYQLQIDATGFESKDGQYQYISCKNYAFVFAADYEKEFEILPETIGSEDLLFDVESKNAVIKDEKIYVRKSGFTLKIKAAETDLYDAAYVQTDKGIVNLTTDGLTAEHLEVNEKDSVVSIQVYLKDGDKNQSYTTEIKIYLDDEAPNVWLKVGQGEYQQLGELHSVKFDTFNNEILTAGVKVADKDSDYESWKYYRHKTGEDITADDAKEIIETLDQDEWTTVTKDDTPHELDIKVEGKEDPGNYVLFIQTYDRVGNIRYYTSNGIVIDVKQPEIPEVKLTGTKTAYAFSGNVTAEIKIIDPIQVVDNGDKVISGIKNVKYEIIMNGNSYKTDKSGNRSAISEPVTLWSASEAKTSFSLSELQNQEPIVEKLLLSAEQFESNDLALRITVQDNAGNIQTGTTSFKIDKTAPSVKVEYKDTVKEPQNSIYFNKGRQAVITVIDANFDAGLVKFCLKREGENEGTYTLAELAAKLGISISWIDSQPGSDLNYTSKRTHTAVINFSKDNYYEFEVIAAEDKAGNAFNKNNIIYINKGSKFDQANKKFVVDTKAPKITVSYQTGKGGFTVYQDSAKRVYQNEAVTAKVTIDEHNFVLNNAKVNAEAKLKVSKANPGSGEKSPDSSQYTQALQGGTWGQNSDLKTMDLKFTVDANYGLRITYTDLAGNTAVYDTAYFTVDKTKPTGTVTVGDLGIWSKFVSKTRFGLFSQKTQKITVTGADVTSPVAGIYYHKSQKSLTREDMETVKWKKGTSFSKKPEEAFIVYAKVTDQAGNTEYFSSNGIVLDKTSPGPAIKITADDPANGIYNGDVAVNISVEDPTSGNTYAGLKSVSYEILNGDSVTQNGNFDSSLTPASKRVKKISRDIVVDATKNNSNFVTIRVTAVDNAGNTASVDKAIKIDITAPSISVSYNNIEASNDTFYHENRIATVTITERNFDPNNVQFEVVNSDGAQPVTSGWTSSSDAGISDSAVHTCTVNFDGDGDYAFSLKCTDLAGNSAEYGKTDSFTVDKTVPEIEVTYDNNDAKNGRYYNKERKATVKITEHNFNASDVKASIGASLKGQKIEAPALSSFTSSGNVHTATIKYEADADYIFEISYADKAGNTAESYKQDSFTIDKTAPEIKLTGFAKANKGDIVPQVICDDVNYSAEGVKIQLTGVNHPSLETNSTSDESGRQFTVNNFTLDKSAAMDDVYTLKVSVTDLAGNVKDETSVFSVNRFGSAYTMGSGLSQMLEDYYTNSPDDLIITETNTDALEFVKITCSKDGSQMELESGKHYAVAEEGDDESWKVYTYTIKKDNFEEDGKYVVTVYSKDAAENTSSNQEKNKSIEFVVDRTSPTVVVTGIENGSQYRSNSQMVTIDAKDNIYLKSMKVEIGAEGETPTIKEFTEEELNENYGVISDAILQANKWQVLRVSAVDMAGNTYVSEDIRVLVTPNLWVQYYMNKPLFFGSIILAILLMAGVILLIRKRRQR